MNKITLSSQARISYVRKLVSFAFIVGIALSFNLWISDRLFPLLPVSDLFSFSNQLASYILIFLFLLLLVGNIIVDNRMISAFLLILLLIILSADQNRWQPWVYLYFLFLVPFAFNRNTTETVVYALPYFQIIVIGVYVWSGIHKLNPNFVNGAFYEILTRLLWFQDRDTIEVIKPFGYALALVEIGLGVCLFVVKLRRVAIAAVVVMHVFIIIYLSPLGIASNAVVYPWNVAMVCLVFLLFYKVDDKIELWPGNRYRLINVATVLMFWCVPVLNFFGMWDNYLSFSLYSGKPNVFYVAISDREINKIDTRLKQYFLPSKGFQGGELIDIHKWSMEELNVPFYPETAALKKLGKSFCMLGINENELYFLEFELPLEEGKFLRFTCKDLDNTKILLH